MTDPLQELRARRGLEGDVFWASDNRLAVLDPELAARVNAANYHDLTLPEQLADFVSTRQRGSWRQVRAAWAPRMRDLTRPEVLAALRDRMDAILRTYVDRHVDLVRLAHEVCTFSLVPLVLCGLAKRDEFLIQQRLRLDIADLTRALPRPRLPLLVQVRAARVIRRELRGRAGGSRPRQQDLADPVTDLLTVLGEDHAVDAVNTLLAAIGGPPGAAGACLLYALDHYPQWTPDTRFVKEVLRMWSPPLLFERPARCPIDVPGASLKPGQRYLLSPYLLHHDSSRWKDPDTFDPGRWLPAAENGPPTGHSYVPFGWAPMSCIGAGLAMAQLTALAGLMTSRYRLEVDNPGNAGITLASVAQPVNFHGYLREAKYG